MISINYLIGLLFTHLLADFFTQSQSMAANKHNSMGWLGLHCGVYGFVFMVFWSYNITGLHFAIWLAGIHFLTDLITSKITYYYWNQKRPRAFFNTIGVDQFIHIVTIIVSYNWFFN